jgi:hypothetical protein
VWAEAATGAETALASTGDVLKLRWVAGTSPGKVPATRVGAAPGIHSIGTVVQENLAAADGEPAHTGTLPDSIRWFDEAAGAIGTRHPPSSMTHFKLVSRNSDSRHKSRSAAPGWQGARSEDIGHI